MAEGIESSGSIAVINLLDDVALTSDPDDNTSDAYSIAPLSQLELVIDYTMNDSETDAKASIRLLLSENGTDFHEYSIASDQTVSAGIIESILYPRRFRIDGLTGGVTETRWFAIPTSAKYFKVAASEADAGAGAGAITVKAVVSDGLRLY